MSSKHQVGPHQNPIDWNVHEYYECDQCVKGDGEKGLENCQILKVHIFSLSKRTTVDFDES